MIKTIVADAIIKWGPEAQLAMLQEECAELIVAVSHFRRNRISENELAEEVADVTIMLEAVKMMIGDEDVDVHIEFKLKRLQERLDNDDG